MYRDIIWHFTDLHFSQTKGPVNIKPVSMPKGVTLPNIHIQDFQKMLFANHGKLERAGLLPNWIVCTGDFATYDPNKEMEVPFEFLSNLATEFQVPPNHVVVAPGNHDVERREGEAFSGQFYRLADEKHFTSPKTILAKSADDGLLLIPLDTTTIIQKVAPDCYLDYLDTIEDHSIRDIAESILKRCAERACSDEYIRAGIIQITHMSTLKEIIGNLRKRHGDLAFPVVVSHHPISSPPLREVKGDIQDNTVFAPLLNHQLFVDHVQLVLQGHRHSPVVHLSRQLGSESQASPLLTVTGPSLYTTGKFVCLVVHRSRSGMTRNISGYLLDEAGIKNDGSSRAWFDRTLWHDVERVSGFVQKSLHLDKLSFSRVRYYLHDVYRSEGSKYISIPIRLNTHGGVISSDLAVEKVGVVNQGHDFQYMCTGHRNIKGKDDAHPKLIVRGTYDAASFVISNEAHAAHAYYSQEADLMYGKRLHDVHYEFTDVLCQYPTKSMVINVEYPSADTFPEGDVFVKAFEADLAEHPIRNFNNDIKGLSCIRNARVLRCLQSSRIIIRIPYPIPGLVYVVYWQLRDFPEEWKSAVTDQVVANRFAKLKGPSVYSWGDAIAGLNEMTSNPFKSAILRIAKTIGNTGLKVDKRNMDIAFQVIDTPWRRVKPKIGNIRTVAAVCPKKDTDSDAYRATFGYGTGVVGVCMRARRPYEYHRGEKTNYQAFVDKSRRQRKYRHLYCMPGVLNHENFPCVAFTLGSFNDDLENEPKVVVKMNRASPSKATLLTTIRYLAFSALNEEMGKCGYKNIQLSGIGADND